MMFFFVFLHSTLWQQYFSIINNLLDKSSNKSENIKLKKRYKNKLINFQQNTDVKRTLFAQKKRKCLKHFFIYYFNKITNNSINKHFPKTRKWKTWK